MLALIQRVSHARVAVARLDADQRKQARAG